MSYFQTLKDSITCKEAAEHYGLKVNAVGMARCPFHSDHTPSLKLSQGFHCFGCGIQGDVITFVSKLFGISAGEAVQKLASDFHVHIHLRGPPVDSVLDSEHELELWVCFAKEILHRYYDRLVLWKQFLCPTVPEAPWHPLFVEALQNQATIRELIHILEFGSKQEHQEIYEYYRKMVISIDRKTRTLEYSRNLSKTES